MKPHSLDNLVDFIYQSAEQQDSMAEVIGAISEKLNLLGGQHVYMNRQFRTLSATLGGPFKDSPANEEYLSHYHALDPRFSYFIRAQPGQWLDDKDRFPNPIERARQVRCSEFYDYLRRYDGENMLVGAFSDDEGGRHYLSLLQRHGRIGLSTEHTALLSRLTPHLHRAIRLQQKYRQFNGKDVLTRHLGMGKRFGLIWLNSHCDIVTMNPTAQHLLDKNDGLLQKRNRLFAADPSDTERLKQACSRAVDVTCRQGGYIAIRRRHARLPIIVTIMPLRPDPVGETPLRAEALLTLHTVPDERNFPLDHLRALYGLTPAEVKLANSLLNNLTAEEYAVRTGTSIGTVRTHLKHLLAKMGVRRQAELIRLLLLCQPA